MPDRFLWLLGTQRQMQLRLTSWNSESVWRYKGRELITKLWDKNCNRAMFKEPLEQKEEVTNLTLQGIVMNLFCVSPLSLPDKQQQN